MRFTTKIGLLAAGALLALPAVAAAGPVYPTAADDSSPLVIHTQPNTSSPRAGAVPPGARVEVLCQTAGQRLSDRKYGTTSLWDRVRYGSSVGFVTDLYVLTNVDRIPGVPDCGAAAPPPPPPPPPPGPPPASGPVDALSWDAPKRCTSGPQPGALAVQSWLKATFPSGSSAGIYNCRSVRGGKNLSLHGEGRAVDWHVNTATGDQIAARLQANNFELARRMGAQEIIWNRRIWTAQYASRGWQKYNGVNQHTDHVHIGLNWRGARKQTSFYAGR
jgi:uncharacterized protein YraI